MWGWWQTGDNLATLCGEKERQRSDAAFFFTFFSQEKNLGPTGFDPRSKQPDDWQSYTLTSTPNFTAVINGSDPYSPKREPNSSFSPARWQRDWPLSLDNTFETESTTWVASPWGFSGMTIQPALYECHACCSLQAGKPGIQPVVGNTHATHVEQNVSSFQKILRGSQLTWYTNSTLHLILYPVPRYIKRRPY